MLNRASRKFFPFCEGTSRLRRNTLGRKKYKKIAELKTKAIRPYLKSDKKARQDSRQAWRIAIYDPQFFIITRFARIVIRKIEIEGNARFPSFA